MTLIYFLIDQCGTLFLIRLCALVVNLVMRHSIIYIIVCPLRQLCQINIV